MTLFFPRLRKPLRGSSWAPLLWTVLESGDRGKRLGLHVALVALVMGALGCLPSDVSQQAIAAGAFASSLVWACLGYMIHREAWRVFSGALMRWERLDGTVRGLLRTLRNLLTGAGLARYMRWATFLVIPYSMAYYCQLGMTLCLLDTLAARTLKTSLLAAGDGPMLPRLLILFFGFLLFCFLNRASLLRSMAREARKKALTGLPGRPRPPRLLGRLWWLPEALLPVRPPLVRPLQVALSLFSLPEHSVGAYLKALARWGYRLESSSGLTDCLRRVRVGERDLGNGGIRACLARLHRNGKMMGYVLGFVSGVDVRPVLARYSQGLSYGGALSLGEPRAYFLVVSLSGELVKLDPGALM